MPNNVDTLTTMGKNAIEKLTDLISSSPTLKDDEKNQMLSLCTQMSTHFSDLERFEMRYPRLVAWVDLISRTLSRIGI